MSALAVHTADKSELDTVVRILTEAFQDDPISGWVFPGAERRRTGAHPAFFTLICQVALEHGRIDVLDDHGAALVWLPGGPEEGEPEIPGLDPAESARLTVLFGLMNERTPPADPPHRHAQFLGVRPSLQGTGLGGKLFRHGLDRYDAEGLPTYLEASSPRNSRLYRRLGFRDHGAAFTLPDDGPPMQPMWRDAA